MFPGYHNWSLFWARWIQSISYHSISLRLFLISSHITPTSFKRNAFYIFIEHTIMQQHHQQVTMVTSFVILFRPSSENESFRIKEKLHSRLNVKMGRYLPIYICIYIYFFPQIYIHIYIFPSNIYTYRYISPKYIYIYIHTFFLIISFFLACYMFLLSRVPWFHDHNHIWRDVQITKILIMQFSSASYHLFSCRSKYLSPSPHFQKFIFLKHLYQAKIIWKKYFVTSSLSP
jgi:hypothetical protein